MPKHRTVVATQQQQRRRRWHPQRAVATSRINEFKLLAINFHALRTSVISQNACQTFSGSLNICSIKITNVWKIIVCSVGRLVGRLLIRSFVRLALVGEPSNCVTASTIGKIVSIKLTQVRKKRRPRKSEPYTHTYTKNERHNSRAAIHAHENLLYCFPLIWNVVFMAIIAEWMCWFWFLWR